MGYSNPASSYPARVFQSLKAKLMLAAEVAAEPFPFPLRRGELGLVVIDMQRDFVEPGGFGASLGNDVTRLQAIVPAAGSIRMAACVH